MTSKQKGDIALAQAISHFMLDEYEVCLPLGDKQKYDLLVEKAGKIHRVQVKYAGLYAGKDRCIVALRVMGGNQSFYSAKKYAADEFDILFVYTERGESYLLPWAGDIVGKSVLSIEARMYSTFNVTRRVTQAANGGGL